MSKSTQNVPPNPIKPLILPHFTPPVHPEAMARSTAPGGMLRAPAVVRLPMAMLLLAMVVLLLALLQPAVEGRADSITVRVCLVSGRAWEFKGRI